METIEDALAELESTIVALNPNEIAEGDGGWRERKSAQTREMILEAAVQCLAKYGYAKTSTQLVAATAQVSRGAMLHHYATKADLVASVIDFIDLQRLRAFYHQVKSLTDEERMVEGKALEVYWDIFKTPASDAYLELNVASRTDSALRKVFDRKAKRYDGILQSILPSIFPEWKETAPEDLRLARDVILVLLSGLSLNNRVLSTRERRVALRKFVFKAVQELRD
jgi:AcrR family transcriptional regulator